MQPEAPLLFAEYLDERLLFALLHRQFVFTLPKALRVFLRAILQTVSLAALATAKMELTINSTLAIIISEWMQLLDNC